MIFSEESKFLLQQWSTIEKLLGAIGQLREEFKKLLYSVEETLKSREWWNDELLFKRYGANEVYISKIQWKGCIWIGVQDFNPENIFGNGTPASLYIWVSGEDKNKILSELRKIVSGEDGCLSKYFTSSSGGYLLKKHLRKYTEEEYENFIEGHLLQDIADFIEKSYMIIKDYRI